MVHLLHVHPGNACGWRLARTQGKNFSGSGDPRERRWDNNSDHILTAKRHDRGRPISGPATIPCRDPLVGIRHKFDLVASAANFKLVVVQNLQTKTAW
jgi:hypothetical protein